MTMMILMLTARILGERYDTLNALACAALLELFSHPEALFQASFLLSYGTILGIIFFIREWNDQNITEHKLRGTVCLQSGDDAPYSARCIVFFTMNLICSVS